MLYIERQYNMHVFAKNGRARLKKREIFVPAGRNCVLFPHGAKFFFNFKALSHNHQRAAERKKTKKNLVV
jgi:hypothetical protein